MFKLSIYETWRGIQVCRAAVSYTHLAEQMGDWANSMGIEAVYIDKDTTIRQFNNELKWNSIYYR